VNAWRRGVRWSLLALVAVRLVLMVCLALGVAAPVLAVRAVEVATVAQLVACAVLFRGDYRALVPPLIRRLIVHEVKLFAGFVRWICARGPHGVGEGDLAVRYAAGQSFVIYSFLFVSVVETVALALVIPWPVVRTASLAIDVWGVYFVIALQVSCVVHPHVVRADGSLWLRYGVLMEIFVPAEQIARVRLERRFDRGGPAKVRPDASLDMGMGGQTMVTVELTEPVRFVRPLGKEAEARVLRFYADNPAATVAALSSMSGGPRLVGSQPHGVEERVGQARGSRSGPG
jgi:hypothetical protein